MKAGTVLGISPGTKFVGLAVICNGSLVYHAVRSFPGTWSGTKLRTIIHALEQVLSRCQATQVAIKIPDRLPDSLGFTQLLGALNVLCERRADERQYYTLSEIQEEHCTDGPQTCTELMRVIVARYPELMPEYRKELANKNKHYIKVFEAVAAALMPAPKTTKGVLPPLCPDLYDERD